MENKNIVIHISPGSIFLVLFVVIFAWFLYEIRSLIPIVISAIVFSLALIPGKRFLARFYIPGPIAVILMYLFIFVILSFFLYTLLPIIAQQYTLFVESLPKILTLINDFFKGTRFENVVASQLANYSGADPQGFINIFQNALAITGKGIFSFFGNLINVILFLLLTFLFSVKPSVLENALFVLTPSKYRAYVDNLWSRTKTKMGQWFQGQILLVFVIGALTYLPLLLLDVPNAFLLATFAGLMELIPIFGPVIGAVPAVLMALTTGDLSTVLLVILVFFVIQQLENNLIYPLVVSKVVGVSSALVILALVIGAILAGFIGVVIAVPLVGVLQEFFDDIKTGNIWKIVNRSDSLPAEEVA